MSNEEGLEQRYSDLVTSNTDPDLVRLIKELDAAGAVYRAMQPPASLDAAIRRLLRDRNTRLQQQGHAQHSVSRDSGGRNNDGQLSGDLLSLHLVTRRDDRRGWLRQGVELAAAALVIVFVAGLLVVAFGSQRNDDDEKWIGSDNGTPGNSTGPAPTNTVLVGEPVPRIDPALTNAV
jgi:hypothetical protein